MVLALKLLNMTFCINSSVVTLLEALSHSIAEYTQLVYNVYGLGLLLGYIYTIYRVETQSVFNN